MPWPPAAQRPLRRRPGSSLALLVVLGAGSALAQVRPNLKDAISRETEQRADTTEPAPPDESPDELARSETAMSAAYGDTRGWDNDEAKPKPASTSAGTGRAKALQARYLLDTGRLDFLPPEPDALRLQIHGEYQLRGARLSDLPLYRPASTGGSFDSLGQTSRIYHWLRLRSRVDWLDKFSVLAELDAPYGLFAGQATNDVTAAAEALDDVEPVRADPRWLYLEWRERAFSVTFGQEPFHLGMGLIANDGNSVRAFGDARGGDRVDGVTLTLHPLGADTGWDVKIAGNVVFADQHVDARDGGHATQAVLRSLHHHGASHAELSGIYRRQRGQSDSDPLETSYTLDAAAGSQAAIHGLPGFVFAEGEFVYRSGSVASSETRGELQIREFGGAGRLGFVLTSAEGSRRWGRFVTSLELGWASGDADANDAQRRRLVFHPNHKVGLLLFDEVLAWKSARAQTLGETDPSTRAAVDRLATNGGVAGAAYLNPVVIVRPLPALDVRAGVVLAQATSDVVDPLASFYAGSQNFDSGSARARDLGTEFDLGVEYRLGLEHQTLLSLGAQAGLLLPGSAFDQGNGSSLGVQSIAVLRVGLQF